MLLFLYKLYQKYIIYCNESRKINKILSKLNYNGYNINNKEYKFITKDLNSYKIDYYFWILLCLIEAIVFYYMLMSILSCYSNIKERLIHILLLSVSTSMYSILSIFNNDCLKRYLNTFDFNNE